MAAPSGLFVPKNPDHAKFKTGWSPTPQHQIARLIQSGALRVHEVPRGVKSPASFAMIPKQRSMFLNDQDGDCVSAEGAFNISAVSAYCATEWLASDATVLAFCNKYGVLNGADLPSVMQAMESDGFHQSSDTVTEGKYAIVDQTNLAAIQNAISNAGGNSPSCLKLGMASSTLPSGAGSQDGWYAFGAKSNQGEDHSTCLCGYGTAKFCFDALGVAVPSGVDPTKADCLLHYTWSTIGVVDLAWLNGNGNVSEAYIRASTMLNGKPWTKGPPPPPPPPNGAGVNLVLADGTVVNIPDGTYGGGGGTNPQIVQLAQLIEALAGGVPTPSKYGKLIAALDDALKAGAPPALVCSMLKMLATTMPAPFNVIFSIVAGILGCAAAEEISAPTS